MMNKIKQTLIAGVLAVAVAVPLFSTPVLAQCGGAKETAIIKCSEGAGEGAIIYLLRYVIQLMTYGIGIVAVGGVILAGIMYASAGGSQEQIKKAKVMLFNIAIGLVAYAFMFAITNFLIPGGVFN